MYYVISKLSYFLFEPSTLIILSLLFVYKKCDSSSTKKAILLVITLVYLFSNEFIFDVTAGQWESEYKQSSAQIDTTCVYDFGIVMGGMCRRQPQSEEIQFSRSGDRLFQAIKLYKTGRIKKIIFTGGSGNLYQPEIKEGEYIRKYLLEIGLPRNSFIIESLSDNTNESALYTSKLLKHLKLDQSKLVLITSAVHMRRSLACFQKQNITTIVPYATDFYSGKFRFDFDHCFLPETITLANYYTVFHEMIGYSVYKLMGYC